MYNILFNGLHCFCIFVHWHLFLFSIWCQINNRKQGTQQQPTEQTVLYVYQKIHENGVLELDNDEELVLKGSRKGVLLTEVWKFHKNVEEQRWEKNYETKFQVIKSR